MCKNADFVIDSIFIMNGGRVDTCLMYLVENNNFKF